MKALRTAVGVSALFLVSAAAEAAPLATPPIAYSGGPSVRQESNGNAKGIAVLAFALATAVAGVSYVRWQVRQGGKPPANKP